jgi:hypothetical protein
MSLEDINRDQFNFMGESSIKELKNILHFLKALTFLLVACFLFNIR